VPAPDVSPIPAPALAAAPDPVVLPHEGEPMDLDGVRDLWPAVLDAIREQNSMLGAALAGAVPVELRGEELIVAFDQSNAFMRKKAEDRANRDVLVDAIRTMTGMRTRVAFDLRDLSDIVPEMAAAAQPLGEDELLYRLKTAFDAEEVLPDAEPATTTPGDQS
jgi:DNA polymerase-3 subunit gamma/tau